MSAVLARASRSEWARVWSLRASWVLLGLTAVAVVGLGALVGSDAADDPAGVPADASAWDGARLTGMFALFGMVALAAVASTADHGSGGIVTTMLWTPRRGLLLAARSLTLTLGMTAIGLVLVVAAATTVWAFLPAVGLPVGDGASTVGELAWVLGGGTALAVGLGLLTRSTAGALVSALALLLVLPPLVANLPFTWTTTVAEHLPGSAALFLVAGEGPADEMTTASARLTLVTWAASALLLGGARLLRSDTPG